MKPRLELGIKVARTLNAFTTPVTDTVLGYMLAFVRRGPWMDQAMKRGEWKKIPGKTLSECTLGVIGIGNIGKAVTRRARAFGMKVLGNDIIEIDHVFITETGIEMTNLETSIIKFRFCFHQLRFESDQPSFDQCQNTGADEA